ncbi:MAG: succinate dehydrogenase, cytochrome b556 subunit [Cellvibrionaceae bacterium]
MTDKRPVNLDLTTIRFPITAIVSITHRISGVVLYAAIAVLLWMLQASLASEESFLALKDLLGHPLAQFVLWATLAAIAYHLVMGIRHMIMDLGWGESLKGGRRGAQLALGCALILIVLAGVWVW